MKFFGLVLEKIPSNKFPGGRVLKKSLKWHISMYTQIKSNWELVILLGTPNHETPGRLLETRKKLNKIS